MFQQKILLASKSPRRSDLLRKAGFTFRVVVADIDESRPENVDARDFPEFIAEKKAEAVAEAATDNEIILAADTIVLKNNIIYGKPNDAADAEKILRQLSGNFHEVITGVFLLQKNKKRSFSVTTKVFFKPLSENYIRHYIQKYNPLDKAGAYAIQEWIGLVGIEKIEGCYFNVVGLPVSKLIDTLYEW